MIYNIDNTTVIPGCLWIFFFFTLPTIPLDIRNVYQWLTVVNDECVGVQSPTLSQYQPSIPIAHLARSLLISRGKRNSIYGSTAKTVAHWRSDEFG